jgi:hypothetical protein
LRLAATQNIKRFIGMRTRHLAEDYTKVQIELPILTMPICLGYGSS